MYGLALPASLLLPFMIISLDKKQRKKALEIYILALIFLVLSLGTTTPIVKIFGKATYWLTYERFLLVASMLFISLFASFLPKLEVTLNRRRIPIYALLTTILWIIISFKLLLESHSIFFQDPIKTYDKNIRSQYTNFALEFLNNVSGNYRYQTFGYGRPIGEIYFYSRLPTLDTDYFTGRTIDWIREMGIDEIDQIKNKTLLDIFLTYATNYSVKYMITFDDFYFDYFKSKGWKPLSQKTFELKKVAIWENPENVEEVKYEKEKYELINYCRGILPLALLFVFIFIKYYHKN
jgi:hypothetical protein